MAATSRAVAADNCPPARALVLATATPSERSSRPPVRSVAPAVASVLACLLIACASRVAPGASASEDAGGTDTSQHGESGDEVGDAEGTDEADCGATQCDDLPAVVEHCDLYAQDCPAGMKCTHATAGHSINTAVCVPISGNQVVGETCIAEYVAQDGDEGVSYSALVDDCVEGAVCVTGEDPLLPGVCQGLCNSTREPEGWTCDGLGHVCAGGGEMRYCALACDPLLQDCPGETVCEPGYGVASFVCRPSGTIYGEYSQDLQICPPTCAPGLVCREKPLGDYCGGSALCCTPMCNVTGDESECTLGRVCVPFFAGFLDPTPWPGYEHLGVCTLE